MPVYDLACKSCGQVAEAYIPLARYGEPLSPCACGGERYRKLRPLYVISDIAPYQAVGTDVATGTAPRIAGRAQHRDYLKRNGYFEVGDEALPKGHDAPATAEIGREVKRVMDEKGIKA